MLEKKYAGNKEFAAYAGRTNAFFPWFPKKPQRGFCDLDEVFADQMRLE
jgi:hypothetical protein